MAPSVDIVMPQMGVSVSEGTIVEWLKQVGDEVAYEEPICEISTDKIEVEVPAVAAGVVAEILVEAGSTVAVGAVLARVVPKGSAPSASPPSANGAAAARTVRGRYSPVVKRMAAEHGVDLGQVPGSGREARVTKKDLLAYVEQRDRGASRVSQLHGESPYRPDEPTSSPSPQPSAAPPAGLESTESGGYLAPPSRTLSRMRQTIGAHMRRSLEEAATCTNWMEVDMTAVERLRAERGLTALPFIASAVAATLAEHPSLNAWLEGDRHTLHEDVNLGIAVSLGDEGLLVPVILAAQKLSVSGLAERIGELAERARAGRLVPDQLTAGTFSISNAGRLGSLMATPIINRPQVAILGVEAIQKRAVVVTDSDGEAAITVRTMTTLGLSWDHRALDGVAAAEFLASLKRRLEAVAR